MVVLAFVLVALLLRLLRLAYVGIELVVAGSVDLVVVGVVVVVVVVRVAGVVGVVAVVVLLMLVLLLLTMRL